MLFVVLTIENLFSGVINKFSKISGIIFLLFLSILNGQGSLNTRSDYGLYMNSYNLGWENFEKGYTLISKMGKFLNLDYSSFRMIVSIIAMIILIIALLRFTGNLSIVSFFYSISIFVFDAIQVRNSLMLSLVILAFSFLTKRKIKNYILSIFILILAASIHTLALAFLIPVLLSIFSINVQKKMILIMIPFSFIFVVMGRFFNGELIRFLQFLLSIFNFRNDVVNNIGNVYVNQTGLKYTILSVFISLIQAFVILIVISSVDWKNDRTGIKLWGIPVAILGILSVIMMQVSADYCRLLRNTSLFLFIIIAMMLENNNKSKKVKINSLLFLVSGLILSELTFYLQISLYPGVSNDIPYILHLL